MKEDAKTCKELINDDKTPHELERVKREGRDLKEIGGDDETLQDMISEDNRAGFSGRAEHHLFQISQDHDDELFSPVHK